MTNKEKREWAELLVSRTSMNQKAIAEKVGVSPKTMSNWWTKFNWEQLRTSFFITKGQELQRIYVQISNLNTEISERPERFKQLLANQPENKALKAAEHTYKAYATSKEADTLTKLAAAARSLEVDISLADIIDVFLKFTEWLRGMDFEKAKEVNDLMDAYIKEVVN